MSNAEILGLQGARATGAEPTFDDQPMQAGTHLRWAFAPELGFPPGGFQLCRRVARPDDPPIRPPREIWQGRVARRGNDQPGNDQPGNNQPGDNQPGNDRPAGTTHPPANQGQPAGDPTGTQPGDDPQAPPG